MLNKVRIAVAMNEFGQWAAYGEYKTQDETAKNEALANVPQGDCAVGVYFVEAEIVPPKPIVVEGKVLLPNERIVENGQKSEGPEGRETGS